MEINSDIESLIEQDLNCFKVMTPIFGQIWMHNQLKDADFKKKTLALAYMTIVQAIFYIPVGGIFYQYFTK